MWLAQLPWLIDAGERQQLAARDCRRHARAHDSRAGGGARRARRRPARSSSCSRISIGAIRRASVCWRISPVGRGRAACCCSAPIGRPSCTRRRIPWSAQAGAAASRRLRGSVARLPDGGSRRRIRAIAAAGRARRSRRRLHRRTDGNPLFMVNVIDYLLARGALVSPTDALASERNQPGGAHRIVPESLRTMIERQLDRLSPDERRVLEAASVAGAAFSAGRSRRRSRRRWSPPKSGSARWRAADRSCGSRRQTWPDGTQSDGYEFIHALYQHVLYERIGTARRSQCIAGWANVSKRAIGNRSRRSQRSWRCTFNADATHGAPWVSGAGRRERDRGAAPTSRRSRSSIRVSTCCRPAEGPERDACELQLRVPLGVCYVNTRGYAAAEVGTTFERAHTLCRRISDTAQPVSRAARPVDLRASGRTCGRRAP